MRPTRALHQSPFSIERDVTSRQGRQLLELLSLDRNVLLTKAKKLHLNTAAQRFQMTKTRQKLHKKICEIAWVRLMLATIWQVSEMQRMQSSETEIMQICWNRFWKNSWKHIRWTYIWRVLAISTKLVAPFYVKGKKKHLEKIEISLVQSNSAVPYDVRSVILQFFSIRCNNASACA